MIDGLANQIGPLSSLPNATLFGSGNKPNPS
jgi:hypothetical protein